MMLVEADMKTVGFFSSAQGLFSSVSKPIFLNFQTYSFNTTEDLSNLSLLSSMVASKIGLQLHLESKVKNKMI